MSNEEMWDKLFERIDSLKAELKPSETDISDALALASHGFLLSFVSHIVDHPIGARKFKDDTIEGLKKSGLSPNRTEIASKLLTALCDVVETP